MPPFTSPMGRLSLALTLILFCVVVGLVVVSGSGGSQAPATGFGDLAATVEARRTASAPTPTPTPTLARAILGWDPPRGQGWDPPRGQGVPLLTIGNQGDSELEWRLWAVYHAPLGSARPLRVAVLGADAFDTLLALEADPELAADFYFANAGDNWTSATLEDYDLLMISESTGQLTGDELETLATFQASGRGMILGLAQVDNLSPAVYAQLSDLFGIEATAAQHVVPGLANQAHPVGRGVTVARLDGPSSRLQVRDGEWVVQDQNGSVAVAARQEVARTLVFGGSLAGWLASNPQLVRQGLSWAGTGWLFISPLSGQVPAQSSQVITAQLDTSGFFAGSHQVDVVVESNDPASPRLRLPIQLEVTGDPQMRVAVDSLDFAQVYVGYERTQTLRIHNAGIAELQVRMRVDTPGLGLAPEQFVVAPRQSQAVTLTFQPGVSQALAAIIHIDSNDPISPTRQIGVTGQGVVAPAIAISAPEQTLLFTRTVQMPNAQIQIGVHQVEQPTPSAPPTPSVTATPSATLTPSATPTVTPGSTGNLPTQPADQPAGAESPGTAVALHSPTSTVAVPTITPSSTATSRPAVDTAPDMTATPTSVPVLVIARPSDRSPAAIRATPDDDAPVLARLAVDAIFFASARSQDTGWLYGYVAGTTERGWIANQQITLLGDPQRLPVQTP